MRMVLSSSGEATVRVGKFCCPPVLTALSDHFMVDGLRQCNTTLPVGVTMPARQCCIVRHVHACV